MIPIAESTIFDEELEKFVLGCASDVDSDDEESEDDSCALNVSCHSSHFKEMIKDKNCGSQAVKRRKLQTHLDDLDFELASLCCSYNAKQDDCHDRSTSKKDILERDVAPLSVKYLSETAVKSLSNTNSRKWTHQPS
jgi:hypothetical protein